MLAMLLNSDGPSYELRLVINGTSGDADTVELEHNHLSGWGVKENLPRRLLCSLTKVVEFNIQKLFAIIG